MELLAKIVYSFNSLKILTKRFVSILYYCVLDLAQGFFQIYSSLKVILLVCLNKTLYLRNGVYTAPFSFSKLKFVAVIALIK